jgi:hypothetical protein
VNTAYVAAAALGAFAALLVFVGARRKDDGFGYVLLAIIVLLFAMVFAGAGIDIQYYQAGDIQ